MKQLDINETQKISYCIPTELRDEQIKINLKKVSGRVEVGINEIPEPIAIVCFGPSLNDTWEQLRDYKYIMTCSGAHKFLLDKGIIPDYHVELEPREHKIKMLGEPHKDVQYLIASTIHPKYLDALKGYDVKLWHIFANENEGSAILPRGEWAITGGSSVGLRCLTLASFLGFRKLHVFGMDGSFGKSGTHSSEHPNAPKESFETEYEGVKYLTTPSILFCAKETFKELDQLKDVKATFFGEGLLQHMAKKYIPNHTPYNGVIAFNKPELISKEYIELNRKLHEDNPAYGMGGAKHRDTVIKLSEANKTTSILDYGAGKQQLAKSLPFPIWSYDPSVPEISASPQPADIVCCTDVLEHIEPDKLQFVLDDLKRCVRQVGYFVISTRKAVKTYANGANTHSIVQGKDWWEKKLSKYFDVASIIEKQKECELHVVVGPRKQKQEIKDQSAVASVPFNGDLVKFSVPNDVIKWRVDTLFTKEKVTVDWITTFKKNELVVDVGANMGGYSMLASKMGAKVIAFEPEAENFALLQKNILLNNSNAVAYCAAVTDKYKIDKLFLSKRGVGGSCHSFAENKNEKVQGCIGIALDDLNIEVDHIKIDVDGQEPKVIAGAERLLKSGVVKSLLIEVNTNLESHNKMVADLLAMDYWFDQKQVDKAVRKDGPFKGCAEYLFKRKNWHYPIDTHIADVVSSRTLNEVPFKHIYVENLFPQSFYDVMVNSLPKNYTPIESSRGTKGYPQRFTATPDDYFWRRAYNYLLSGAFRNALCEKFGIDNSRAMSQDILLVRDLPGYSIPPHTDSTNKIITVLIYLAQDESLINEGTSIFIPRKDNFECEKGVHYAFADFVKVKTLPFKPNSMFAFARTNNSFHGVEPCKGVRNVLLYNLNYK